MKIREVQLPVTFGGALGVFTLHTLKPVTETLLRKEWASRSVPSFLCILRRITREQSQKGRPHHSVRWRILMQGPVQLFSEAENVTGTSEVGASQSAAGGP